MILSKKRNDRDYFNGGVYRTDKEFAKKYSFDKLYNFCSTVTKETLKSSPKAKYNGFCVDQDILNYFIENDDVLILPSSIYDANHCMKKEKCHSPKILHYYGPSNKPNGKMDKQGKDEWFFKPWHEMRDEAFNKLEQE